MSLGQKLKIARNSLTLTQADVALKLNVSRSTISSWEINRTQPNLDDLVQLSNLYKLSLDDLLREENTFVSHLSQEVRLSRWRKKIINYGLVISSAIIFGLMCFTVASNYYFLYYDSKNNSAPPSVAFFLALPFVGLLLISLLFFLWLKYRGEKKNLKH